MTYSVILIKVDHRSQEAGLVQKVLTEYGCNIKVRLGLHEVSTDQCAQDGLIILHVEGKPRELKSILEKLNKLEYVKAELIKL